MNRHSQFLYDVIKAYAEAFDVDHVWCGFYSRTFSALGEACSTEFGITLRLKSGGVIGLPVKVPELIPAKDLYRAILEVSEKYGVRHHLTEEDIRPDLASPPATQT